jgi:general secretion pathway protein A
VLGWQQLLTLWKLPASSITVAPTGGCTAGTRADVHCVQGKARLEILTALDRPLLLRLQAAGNRYAWAVLLGADARSVRLHMGQREIHIDRSVLLAHWNGDYAALWVGQGALPATPELISAFQNARGLPADGVAGSLTLMALANGLPGPHLLRVLE